MQKNKILNNRNNYSRIFGVSIIAVFMLITALSAVVLFATPAEAQEPGVTKWLQAPDLSPNGLDVDATAPIEILADDFFCTGTGPITDIHIWGSWLLDILPMGEPDSVIFTLSIHADIPDPDGDGSGYSMPDEPALWMRTFGPGEFYVEPVAGGPSGGYYNPCTGEYIFPSYADTCWRYDFYIDLVDAFIQQEGNIYWLDVQAQPMDDNPDVRFGWKTSVDHWNDDAVYACGMEGDHGPWVELIYPLEHEFYPESIDLAFEITTQIDDIPPTMEDVVEPEDECYTTDAPTFANFGFDDDQNLHLAQYQIDGGSWMNIFYDIDLTEWNDDGWELPGFDGLPEGVHTVHFRVEDDYGNTNGEGNPDYYAWAFCKDTTPPTVGVEFGNPLIYLSGYTWPMIGPHTPVWINASDDGCGGGVKYVEYSLMGGIPGSYTTVEDNLEGDEDERQGYISVLIHFYENCHHEINYRAMDYCGNWNPSDTGSFAVDFYVDATPPDTQIEIVGIEIPYEQGSEYTWFGDCTTKWINVSDDGCEGGAGVQYLNLVVSLAISVDPLIFEIIEEYKIHDQYPGNDLAPLGPYGYEDLDPDYGEISVLFKFREDCMHEVMHWAVDYVDNDEIIEWDTDTNKQNHYVDITHPKSYLSLDTCMKEEYELCVKTTTPIVIVTENIGQEPCIYPEYWSFFRIYVEEEDKWYPDNGDYAGYSAATKQFWKGNWWFAYQDTPELMFYFEEECNHTLKFFTKDPLCNTEDTHIYYFHVDDQAPLIKKSVGTPQCTKPDEDGYEDVLCITTQTPITIESWDLGCCDELTEVYYNIYEVVDDEWEFVETVDLSQDIIDGYLYKVITIPYECEHVLEIVAIDCLGNTATHVEKFFIDDISPSIQKVVGEPQCPKPGIDGYEDVLCINTTTPITIDIWDSGCCNELVTVYYEIYDETGALIYSEDLSNEIIENYLHKVITIPYECEHDLKIVAIDCLGNTANHLEKFFVDETSPHIVKTVGTPQCPKPDEEGYEDVLCIKTTTPITIEVWDAGCCDELVTVYYEIYNETGVLIYSEDLSNYIVDGHLCEVITIPYECEHVLKIVAIDCIGNQAHHVEKFFVDDKAPFIDKQVVGDQIVGEFGYPDGYDYWISCDTDIVIDAWDLGCCNELSEVYYEYDYKGEHYGPFYIFNDQINELPKTINFANSCEHILTITAKDCLGNTATDVESFYVDCTPPDSTKSFEGPRYPASEPDISYFELEDEEIDFFWIQDHGTTVIINSIDDDNMCDVGVDYLVIQIWWDSDNSNELEDGEMIQEWYIYDGTDDDTNDNPGEVGYEFVIEEDCLHKILWYAVDGFGNTEEVHRQYHRVDSQPPAAIKTIGWPSYLETEILFMDDFEDYNYETGQNLYNELIANGWWLHDHTYCPDPDPYDDFWLEYDIAEDNYYLSIRDDSWAIMNVNTRGYENIRLSYNRATATENTFNDYFNISWRIGGCGEWTPVESIHSLVGWENIFVHLDGAEDQDIVQIKFELDNGNHDFGLLDKVYVKGDFYWVRCDTPFSITSTDQLDPCAVGVESMEIMVQHSCNGFSYEEPTINLFIDDNGPYDENLEEGVITFNFTLPRECYWKISWTTVDLLGNALDKWHVQLHIVDCSPPNTIIIKPTDGWYSDGETIPAVVFAEDLPNLFGDCGPNPNCVVGIEDGSEGKGWLVDIVPDFMNIIELGYEDFLYDAESHEYIGNLLVPEGTGLNGTVLFVAGVEDRLYNDWNSMFEYLRWAFAEAMTECTEQGCMDCLFDFFVEEISDFIANRNIVFVGIDNRPPEVNIVEPYFEHDVGLGPIRVYATISDSISGVVSGTPCYITLDGISIGTLYYDASIGGCVGDLPIPVEVLDGYKTLTITVADRAGCLGSDSTTVYVGERPGPTTSGADVQPDPTIIYEDGTGEELTLTATVHSTIAEVATAEYFINDTKPIKSMYGTGTPLGLASGESWGTTMVDVEGTFSPQDFNLVAGEHIVWVHGQDQYGRWGAFDEEEFSLVYETYWRPIYVEIVNPDDDEDDHVFDVMEDGKHVTVYVNAHYFDDPYKFELEDIDVKIWLDSPYGAPDQYYPVSWDGTYFTADIPIYKYSSGSTLDLEAKAQDLHGNKAYDDSSFEVITTIIYDQWMEMEWNKITLPQYSIGCNNNVEKVLSTINNGNFDVVYHYDPDATPQWTSWTWQRYLDGEPQTLNHMFTGEEYWVHIVGEPKRFYLDSSEPTVEITDPASEYEERCAGPDSLNFRAFDFETWIDMVYTQIYDAEQGYWTGSAWVGSATWLECTYDSEDAEYSYWYYTAGDIWTQGHTYEIYAKAVDANGCESEQDHATIYILTPSILVEKTAEGQEYLTTLFDEPFNFTIYVENTGDVPFNGVDIIDYLPIEFIYLDNARVYVNGVQTTQFIFDSSYDDVELHWILVWSLLDTINPGDYMVVEFEANVTTMDVWEENVARAYGYAADATPEANDNAFVKGGDGSPPCEPTWTVTKETWCYWSQGWYSYGYASYEENHARYKIVYENTGDCPITNPTIEDQLPASLVYDDCVGYSVTVSQSGGLAHAFENNAGLWWDFTGDLLPGETIEIIFEANYVGGDYTTACIYDTNWAYGYVPGLTSISASSGIYFNCWDFP